MSNIKPMVDHIAKAYLELSGFPADADGDVKASALVVATRLLAGAPVLYDSLKDEELRKLLTDWRRRAESDNPSEYLDMQDVVAQLGAILDGE